jgi:hypothetical protein
MKVAQQCQPKAIQVTPAPRKMDRDFSKCTCAAETLSQQFSGNGVLQGAYGTSQDTSERAQGLFVTATVRPRSTRARGQRAS